MGHYNIKYPVKASNGFISDMGLKEDMSFKTKMPKNFKRFQIYRWDIRVKIIKSIKSPSLSSSIEVFTLPMIRIKSGDTSALNARNSKD